MGQGVHKGEDREFAPLGRHLEGLLGHGLWDAVLAEHFHHVLGLVAQSCAHGLLDDLGERVPPLVSSAAITDGAWRRVGFVWDGVSRTLYVDGVKVAKDTSPALAGSVGVLNIGAGTTLATGTCWSGLIDDVCIYNWAVKP